MIQIKRWLFAAVALVMPVALAATLTAQGRRGGGAGVQSNLPVKTYVLKPVSCLRWRGDARRVGSSSYAASGSSRSGQPPA